MKEKESSIIETKDLLPNLSEEEYNALKEDIKLNGIKYPIIKDQNGNIVDGNNRKEICDKLKIDCPEKIIDYKDEKSASMDAFSLNIKRRQLSSEQKKNIAIGLNKLKWTQEEIAGIFGVDRTTISNWLPKVRTNGNIPIRHTSENETTEQQPIIDLRVKLSKKQREDIYERHKTGKTQQEIADNYKVNRSTISKIINAFEKKEKKENEIIENAKTFKNTEQIKILEGDVFDKIKDIEDASIDLLCTDPPYKILKDKWDQFKDKAEFFDFTERWLKIVLPKIKDTGRIYISFAPDYQFDFYNILERNNFFGFNYGNTIIWVKRNNNQKFDRKRYRLTYEPIFYLYGKKSKQLNFTDDTFGETQTDVWEIATPQSNFDEGKYHSAQKPLELYRRIISTGSFEGDVVLDCFAGSGTTGIVCKETNRNCILIERDLNNINTIIKGRI